MSHEAPAGWDQWHCRAYDSRSGKQYLGDCFVRARDQATAVKVARAALPMFGVRGRLRVFASPYYPWLDRQISSFIGRAS